MLLFFETMMEVDVKGIKVGNMMRLTGWHLLWPDWFSLQVGTLARFLLLCSAVSNQCLIPKKLRTLPVNLRHKCKRRLNLFSLRGRKPTTFNLCLLLLRVLDFSSSGKQQIWSIKSKQSSDSATWMVFALSENNGQLTCCNINQLWSYFLRAIYKSAPHTSLSESSPSPTSVKQDMKER